MLYDSYMQDEFSMKRAGATGNAVHSIRVSGPNRVRSTRALCILIEIVT